MMCFILVFFLGNEVAKEPWCSQETESAKDAYTAAEDGEGSDEAGVPV